MPPSFFDRPSRAAGKDDVSRARSLAGVADATGVVGQITKGAGRAGAVAEHAAGAIARTVAAGTDDACPEVVTRRAGRAEGERDSLTAGRLVTATVGPDARVASRAGHARYRVLARRSSSSSASADTSGSLSAGASAASSQPTGSYVSPSPEPAAGALNSTGCRRARSVAGSATTRVSAARRQTSRVAGPATAVASGAGAGATSARASAFAVRTRAARLGSAASVLEAAVAGRTLVSVEVREACGDRARRDDRDGGTCSIHPEPCLRRHRLGAGATRRFAHRSRYVASGKQDGTALGDRG
jgi:hypothetical protein